MLQLGETDVLGPKYRQPHGRQRICCKEPAWQRCVVGVSVNQHMSKLPDTDPVRVPAEEGCARESHHRKQVICSSVERGGVNEVRWKQSLGGRQAWIYRESI